MHFTPPTQDLALSPLDLINDYQIADDDGSVYAYGTSHYLEGANASPVTAPIVSIMNTPDDRGYWLTGAGADVFAYGDVKFYGSVTNPNKLIYGIMTSPDGGGYFLVGGGVFG